MFDTVAFGFTGGAAAVEAVDSAVEGLVGTA